MDFDEMDFVFIPDTGWSETGPVYENLLIRNSHLRQRRWAEHKRKVLDERELRKGRQALVGVDKKQSLSTGKKRAQARAPRAMNRIYRSGDSPERVPSPIAGESNLVEVFAIQDERCHFAREVYYHPLWGVLASRGPPTAIDMEQLIIACLERLGLAMLDESVMTIAEMVVGDAFPIKLDDLEQISAGATLLASTGSLNGILALSLLCKMADEDLAFDIADVYVKALDQALFSFKDHVGDGYVVGTLRQLIHDRLLRNQWKKTSPSDWLRTNLVRRASPAKAKSSQEDVSFFDNPEDVFHARPEKPALHPYSPVIQLDNKLRWFVRYHYRVLQSAIIVATGTNPYDVSPEDPQGEIDRVRRFWNAEPKPISLFKMSLEDAVAAGKSRRDQIVMPSARLKRRKTKPVE